MINGLLNLPWFLWAAFALIVAVIYSLIWPHKNETLSSGFRPLILRWGHTLAWVLLAINFLLRGLSPSFTGMANIIALLGGLMYILFLNMTFVVK